MVFPTVKTFVQNTGGFINMEILLSGKVSSCGQAVLAGI